MLSKYFVGIMDRFVLEGAKDIDYLSETDGMEQVVERIEADDREMVHAKEDENTGVRWFSPEDAVAASSEPWFREHIYSKLNEKLCAYMTLVERRCK